MMNAFCKVIPSARVWGLFLTVVLGFGPLVLATEDGAVLSTDFSTHPPGEGIPEGWAAHWADSRYAIAESPSRLVVTSTGSGRSLLAWEKAGVLEGDVEIALLVRQPDSTLPDMPTTRYQIHLHADADSRASYFLDDTGTERQGLRFRHQDADSQRTLASAVEPFSLSIWHHLVLQREGNTLRAKVWPYHTEEPDGWMIEAEDERLHSGRVGVGFFSARVRQEYAWFSVAGGGRQAERAPEDLAGIERPRSPSAPRPTAAARFGTVMLNWYPVTGADYYELERDGELVARGWEISSFADAGVAPATEVVHRVRGVSVLRGPGPWSAEIRTSTPPISETISLSFEREPEAPWTPHQEEISFFEELARLSPRFAFEEVGSSGEGLPLHLIRIGLDGPPSDAEIARRPSILLVGGNHGNEPAGRQGVLFTLRKLALSTDPEVLEWLEKFVVLSVPTMNPDGRMRNRRHLSVPSIDSNRDMLALTSSEAQTIARVIRDHRPDVVVDAHEWGGGFGHHRGEFEISSAGNANAHPEIIALSAELAFDRIMVRSRSQAGWRSHPYQELYGQPTRLRQISALKHGLSLLTESSRHPEIRRVEEADLSRDDSGTNNRRTASQRFALAETLGFLSENLDRITAATADSIAASETNRGPLYTRGDVVHPPGPGDTLNPPPYGWRLLEPDQPGLARVLDLHDIRRKNYRLEDGREITVVPAAQWSRPVAAVALDSDSPYQLDGVRTERFDSAPE